MTSIEDRRFSVEAVTADLTGNVTRLLIAGALGIVAWVVTTDTVTRILFAQSPEPFALVQGLLGVSERWLAEAIHFFIGIVVFPAGYVAVVRRLLPLPWPVAGVLYGLALWVLALGVMAPLAGNPFMLNFGNITWASGLGHAVVGLAIAWSWERAVAPKR